MASSFTDSSNSSRKRAAKAPAITEKAPPKSTGPNKPLSKSKTLHLSNKPGVVNPYEMIATAAYYLAEQRQFAPGNELEDWLAAERQVAKGSAYSH